MSKDTDFTYAPSYRVPEDWQKAVTKEIAVLDKICHDNDIEYFIESGGLLGLERHGGFIPWDNDVDICITEENYKKLLQVYLDGKMPEGYMIVDCTTEDNYPLLFARFLNTNTSCPLSTSSFNKGAHGVFIDIFVMIPVPEERSEQIDAIIDFLVWEQITCYIKRRCISRRLEFFDRYRKLEKYAEEHGRKAAMEKAEAAYRSHIPANPTRYILSSGGARDAYAIIDASWFDGVVRTKFEDIDVDVPVGSRQHLAKHYGGSWRHVPTSGTEFKPYCAANLNIPGKVITEDYMQLIDYDECEANHIKHRKAALNESETLCRYMNMLLALMGELIGDELDKASNKLQKKYYASAATYASGTFTAADAIKAYDVFGALYTEQFRKNFKRFAAPVKASPEYIASALWIRFAAYGDFWVPAKMMDIQEDGNPAFASYMKGADGKKLRQFFEIINKLYLDMDIFDNAAIAEDLKVLRALCPNGYHTKVAEMSLIEDSTEALAFESGLPTTYKESEYIRYFKAKALIANGETEEARVILSQLLHQDSNAYLHLDVKKLLNETGIEALPANETPVFEKTPLPTFKTHSMKYANYGYKAKIASLKYGGGRKLKELRLASEAAAVEAKKTGVAIAGYRAIRRLTDRRFGTWERVYPRKQAILEAAAADDKETVLDLAAPYVVALKNSFNDDQLGLFVDQQIQDAVLPYLKEELGEETVEAILAAIPEAHRVDIDAMLKEKGVKHPYFA